MHADVSGSSSSGGGDDDDERSESASVFPLPPLLDAPGHLDAFALDKSCRTCMTFCRLVVVSCDRIFRPGRSGKGGGRCRCRRQQQ